MKRIFISIVLFLMMFALTFPVWPLICGAAIVKEKFRRFIQK